MQDSRQEEKTQANELLRSFLSGPGEDETLLSQLISEHASPMIRGIIRYRFQGNPSLLPDIEDVHNDIVVSLLDKLRRIRETPGDKSIESFRDYVAVVSYNRCHQYFRQRFPRRRSAENRIRYLLTHAPGFSVWQHEMDWICGMAQWIGRTDVCEADVLRKAATGTDQASVNREFLQIIFQSVGVPVRLEDLVELFADLSPVKDDSIAARVETSNEPPAFYRVYLEKAWTEILELPPKQRRALLLSLRDERGDGMLVVFVGAGIAGMGRMAMALQMTIEELARLWNDLPLSDFQIAELMGIERQQVINLRKCARERLGRKFDTRKR